MKPPTLKQLHRFALDLQTLTRARLVHPRGPKLTALTAEELNCADTLPVLFGLLRNATVTGTDVPLSSVISPEPTTHEA